ncbi:MAG: hypothetical protein LUE92_12350 [Clostridiales bacterium]|nr:hypothetical protein [Clostridiales bacterium]
MGRNSTAAWNDIHAMCEAQNINEKRLYDKAKMLLQIYRRVCWSTIGQADVVAEEMCCYCSSDLDGALIYLEEFAPDTERQRFESRIRTLFETRWMIELIDTAMLRVKEFPDGGEQHFEIISKCYLARFKYSESEMLEVLNMERSRYYDRKKEAIMVFGLSLWGDAIPKLKTFLADSKEDMEVIPYEY